jgi:hypothetical protein
MPMPRFRLNSLKPNILLLKKDCVTEKAYLEHEPPAMANAEFGPKGILDNTNSAPTIARQESQSSCAATAPTHSLALTCVLAGTWLSRDAALSMSVQILLKPIIYRPSDLIRTILGPPKTPIALKAYYCTVARN